MRKSVAVSLMVGGLIHLVKPAYAVTTQDLKNSDLYIPVAQIYNQDSYIKKGSIKIDKNHADGRVIDFVHLEDQGNEVCEYNSQFIYNEAKAELRLKRMSMKKYREDGSVGLNIKMSANFNLQSDSSGYKVYTQIMTGAIGGGEAAEPTAAGQVRAHNIMDDDTVKEKWRIKSDLTYAGIQSSGYNKLYAPISTPFYLTDEYKKLAAIDARASTIKSYIIRGTPVICRLDNGDVKIYYQWIQCDELLPLLLVDAAFYFEEATQKLFRYEPAIHMFDQKSGKHIKSFGDGENSRQECPAQAPAYRDFQSMKAGRYAVK